jgi:hypothetical protein
MQWYISLGIYSPDIGTFVHQKPYSFGLPQKSRHDMKGGVAMRVCMVYIGAVHQQEINKARSIEPGHVTLSALQHLQDLYLPCCHIGV